MMMMMMMMVMMMMMRMMIMTIMMMTILITGFSGLPTKTSPHFSRFFRATFKKFPDFLTFSTYFCTYQGNGLVCISTTKSENNESAKNSLGRKKFPDFFRFFLT